MGWALHSITRGVPHRDTRCSTPPRCLWSSGPWRILEQATYPARHQRDNRFRSAQRLRRLPRKGRRRPKKQQTHALAWSCSGVK
eukprot:15471088-Alexandrium_andersonii.AAC.1